MSHWKQKLVVAMTVFVFAPTAIAAIAFGLVQGVVQSVNVRQGTIAVAGHTYVVGKGTSVAGFAGLPHLRSGETVSVLLAPDGKRALRITVVPALKPSPVRH